MIKEFSAHAKATNTKARVASIVLLILAALDFVSYALMRYYGVQKSGLIGVLAIVFITAAVFIYTKYVSAEYFYDITFDSEGTPIFVVRQVTGKRESTLCRINLADIRKATSETREQRRAHKTPFEYKKYSYIPTFLPNVTYRLVTVSRYEKAEILIEASVEFVELIMNYSAEARELAALTEEKEEY